MPAPRRVPLAAWPRSDSSTRWCRSGSGTTLSVSVPAAAARGAGAAGATAAGTAGHDRRVAGAMAAAAGGRGSGSGSGAGVGRAAAAGAPHRRSPGGVRRSAPRQSSRGAHRRPLLPLLRLPQRLRSARQRRLHRRRTGRPRHLRLCRSCRHQLLMRKPTLQHSPPRGQRLPQCRRCRLCTQSPMSARSPPPRKPRHRQQWPRRRRRAHRRPPQPCRRAPRKLPQRRCLPPPWTSLCHVAARHLPHLPRRCRVTRLPPLPGQRSCWLTPRRSPSAHCYQLPLRMAQHRRCHQLHHPMP